MSKGAVAVAIIALLVGAGGLGIGLMSMMEEPSITPIEAMYLLEKLTPQPNEIVQIVTKEIYGQLEQKPDGTPSYDCTIYSMNITVDKGADLRVEFFSFTYAWQTEYNNYWQVSVIVESNYNTYLAARCNYQVYNVTTREGYPVALVGYLPNLPAAEYKIYVRLLDIVGSCGVYIGCSGSSSDWQVHSTMAAIEYTPGTL